MKLNIDVENYLCETCHTLLNKEYDILKEVIYNNIRFCSNKCFMIWLNNNSENIIFLKSEYENEIKNLKLEHQEDINDLETEHQQDIDDLETELEEKLDNFKKNLKEELKQLNRLKEIEQENDKLIEENKKLLKRCELENKTEPLLSEVVVDIFKLKNIIQEVLKDSGSRRSKSYKICENIVSLLHEYNIKTYGYNR